MNRLFLTVHAKRCAFGCSYCFAEFSQYDVPPALEEVERGEVDLSEVDVVYPACDVDLFAMRGRWADVMERSVRLGRSISVSTKAALTVEQVDALGMWSQQMRERGRVLKVGVSASTMSRCDEIEPRAALWHERLTVLRQLADVGVPTCLVLKPLLADISLDEYRHMLDQASTHADAVVIGDEYVDDERDRRRQSQADLNGSLGSRRVRWLNGQPRWLVREAGE
jgi:DNA repair photolyase